MVVELVGQVGEFLHSVSKLQTTTITNHGDAGATAGSSVCWINARVLGRVTICDLRADGFAMLIF